MSYKKYYEGGWQSGETGGTPITPEALNHMESGIQNAAELSYAKKVGAPHNLLDNSYWRIPKEIVNQRGASGTYGSWGGYTIDRWFVGGKGATVAAVNNGLQLNGNLIQVIPDPEKFANKKITLAAKIAGNVYCCCGTVTLTGVFHHIALFESTGFSFSMSAQDDNNLWVIINAENLAYEWAALYEGEYTAETLPEYQPKGYAAELTECRRYFRKYDAWDGLCTGFIDWQHGLQVYIPTDIPMRVNPTCSAIEGNVVVNGVYVAVNKTPTAVQKNGLIVLSFPGYTVAAEHGAQPCALILGEKGLTLSADL